MSDETPAGSAKGADRSGHLGGSGGEPAPLQSRAHFLENWDWASITEINRGLCARGGAQHGVGRETHEAIEREWEAARQRELTLAETFDFLQACHRGAPFLFFNGNTFAEIGRALVTAILHDLPLARKKEAASLAAHYITGVLGREMVEAGFESLLDGTNFQPGDRVKTLKGTLRGIVLAVMDDRRLKWRAETGSELIARPETLQRDDGE
jgi:hypothetical protein